MLLRVKTAAASKKTGGQRTGQSSSAGERTVSWKAPETERYRGDRHLCGYAGSSHPLLLPPTKSGKNHTAQTARYQCLAKNPPKKVEKIFTKSLTQRGVFCILGGTPTRGGSKEPGERKHAGSAGRGNFQRIRLSERCGRWWPKGRPVQSPPDTYIYL